MLGSPSLSNISTQLRATLDPPQLTRLHDAAAQRAAVADYLNGGRWKLVAELTEVESGKRSDRPELEKALTACRKHKAKLVIAKLDRLSRNVHFISGLMERKVDFVACDMPSANAFMINVYAAVAQEERRMISERTKAGLAQHGDCFRVAGRVLLRKE